MVYDAGLQEAQLDHDVENCPAGASPFRRLRRRSGSINKSRRYSAAANRVAIIADFAARPPHGWNHVVEWPKFGAFGLDVAHGSISRATSAQPHLGFLTAVTKASTLS